MMKAIGVDCRFMNNGRVQVQRLQVDNRWITIEQGRQWVDQQGRHVLIMMPDRQVQEILLRPDTMTWFLRPRVSTGQLA